MWMEKYPPLNNDKSEGLGRLSSLLHNLTSNEQFI